MSADEDGNETAGRPEAPKRGGRRPRAPVTIDLAATPVEPERQEPESAPPTETAEGEETAAPAAPGPEPSAADTEPPRDQSPREAPQPADNRPGFGLFGLVVAGIVGGVIATGLGIAGHVSGVLPSAGKADAAAALQRTDDLSAKLALLEKRMAGLEAGAGSLASNGALEALGGKLAALAAADEATARRLDEMNGAIAAAGRAGTGDASAATAAVAAITARLDRLEKGVAANGTDSVPLVAELSSETEALAAEIKELSARVNALAEAKPAADAGSERAARAFALGALRQAAAKGGAFAGDLGMLAALGTDAGDLAALKPLAEKGAPSSAALAAAFPPVADAILAAVASADPNAGFFGRLLGEARGLVSVRPLQPIPGDTPEAIVSRMSAAASSGDLAAALAERAKLPDAGRAASAAWAEAAADRVEIDRLVGRLAGAPATSPGSE